MSHLAGMDNQGFDQACKRASKMADPITAMIGYSSEFAAIAEGTLPEGDLMGLYAWAIRTASIDLIRVLLGHWSMNGVPNADEIVLVLARDYHPRLLPVASDILMLARLNERNADWVIKSKLISILPIIATCFKTVAPMHYVSSCDVMACEQLFKAGQPLNAPEVLEADLLSHKSRGSPFIPRLRYLASISLNTTKARRIARLVMLDWAVFDNAPTNPSPLLEPLIKGQLKKAITRDPEAMRPLLSYLRTSLPDVYEVVGFHVARYYLPECDGPYPFLWYGGCSLLAQITIERQIKAYTPEQRDKARLQLVTECHILWSKATFMRAQSLLIGNSGH
jgi:hypothetical protein